MSLLGSGSYHMTGRFARVSTVHLMHAAQAVTCWTSCSAICTCTCSRWRTAAPSLGQGSPNARSVYRQATGELGQHLSLAVYVLEVPDASSSVLQSSDIIYMRANVDRHYTFAHAGRMSARDKQHTGLDPQPASNCRTQ